MFNQFFLHSLNPVGSLIPRQICYFEYMWKHINQQCYVLQEHEQVNYLFCCRSVMAIGCQRQCLEFWWEISVTLLIKYRLVYADNTISPFLHHELHAWAALFFPGAFQHGVKVCGFSQHAPVRDVGERPEGEPERRFHLHVVGLPSESPEVSVVQRCGARGWEGPTHAGNPNKKQLSLLSERSLRRDKDKGKERGNCTSVSGRNKWKKIFHLFLHKSIWDSQASAHGFLQAK